MPKTNNGFMARMRTLFGASGPRRVAKGIGPFPADTTFFQSIRLRLGDDDLLSPFVQHPWVYTAVTKRGNAIKSVPLRVHRKDPGAEDSVGEVVDDSNVLAQLFDHVNMAMSQSTLFEATEIDYLEAGEALWFLNSMTEEGREQTEVPKEIIVLDPTKYEPVVDNGVFLGWKKINEDRLLFKPSEILQFTRYNPRARLRGLSSLAPLGKTLKTDHEAAKYNLAFFENGAEVGGIFTTKGRPMGKDQQKQFMDGFNDKHKGSEKRGKNMFLQGGVEFTPNNVTHRDMEYLELRRNARQEISSVMGVPAEIMGFGKNTFENFKEARTVFWQDTIVAQLIYYETQINSNFMAFVEGGKFIVKFDLTKVPALQEDFTDKSTNAATLIEAGFPRSEVNERLGLGFDNVTDDPAPVPATTPPPAPVQEALTLANVKDMFTQLLNARDPQAGQIDEMMDNVVDPMEKALRRTQSDFDKKVMTPIEKKYEKKLNAHFFNWRKDTLSVFNDLIERRTELQAIAASVGGSEYKIEKPTIDQLMTEDDIDQILGDIAGRDAILRNFSDPSYEESQLASIEFLNEVDPNIDLSLDDPETIIALQRMREEGLLPKVVGVNDTVREQLSFQVSEAIANKETVFETAQRIRRVFNSARNRSVTIARTELGTAASASRDFAFDDAEIEFVEWVTSRDEHVRSSHQRNHRKRRKRGDNFANGLKHPLQFGGKAEEVINCRCIVVSALSLGGSENV